MQLTWQHSSSKQPKMKFPFNKYAVTQKSKIKYSLKISETLFKKRIELKKMGSCGSKKSMDFIIISDFT